ncbi:MAG: ribbon-helix-helix protein, CopG family [Gemmatimonadota bacterium]|uniref:ribbon-helix-helix protein, CopG family n=1 Tax=Candidatus Palauibacter soopunensis TaxID=3056739 RepID=UPI0023A6A4CA|nr:ribbon-helix-helix protein, CopG family [Candidatus Palauibacter soopunensis]MDE2878142.1 ribbon-helix-helix protein, CopG family [Candidatus Palauibacter soopunensis]MDE2943076.1 ribbon-helix-helix protein, CopG family [Gemmatimonadota bacterium]
MGEISIPDALLEALDATAAALEQSREEIIQRALERYLHDFDDLRVATARFRARDHAA